MYFLELWKSVRVWFIALVLKTSGPERAPWVRTPPLPPHIMEAWQSLYYCTRLENERTRNGSVG